MWACLQRMQIRDAIWIPEGGNGPRKQLPYLVLELEQIIGTRVVEYVPQRRSVWSEEEELLPVAL